MKSPKCTLENSSRHSNIVANLKFAQYLISAESSSCKSLRGMTHPSHLSHSNSIKLHNVLFHSNKCGHICHCVNGVSSPSNVSKRSKESLQFKQFNLWWPFNRTNKTNFSFIENIYIVPSKHCIDSSFNSTVRLEVSFWNFLTLASWQDLVEVVGWYNHHHHLLYEHR